MITTLGLNWLEYQESVRANQAKEAENMRHNLVTEAEANRANVAKEQLTASDLKETQRAHFANEKLTASQQKETNRANLEKEKNDRLGMALSNATKAVSNIFADGMLGQEALADWQKTWDDALKNFQAGIISADETGQVIMGDLIDILKQQYPSIASGVSEFDNMMKDMKQSGAYLANWLKDTLLTVQDNISPYKAFFNTDFGKQLIKGWNGWKQFFAQMKDDTTTPKKVDDPVNFMKPDSPNNPTAPVKSSRIDSGNSTARKSAKLSQTIRSTSSFTR